MTLRRQIRRVRYRHWIFTLPFVRRYNGMVVGRTILFKGGADEIPPALFRHELIHDEQIDRHGIVRFFSISSISATIWPTSGAFEITTPPTGISHFTKRPTNGSGIKRCCKDYPCRTTTASHRQSEIQTPHGRTVARSTNPLTFQFP
jgi:hypothetical protein